MAIKSLKTMMKDADKLLGNKPLPMVFLDTSAVIDICKSAREEQMRQKGRTDLPLDEIYPDHFLMH